MAEDVAYLSHELALRESVVIGHGLGGNVALALHYRHPHLVSAIILIDSALFIPSLQEEKIHADFASALAVGNALAFYRQALQSMTLPNEDLSRKIIEAEVLKDALVSNGFDSRAVTADCRIPLAYFHSSMPYLDIVALRDACPQLLYGQTLGAGHLSPQEVPGQINAMIDTFLARHRPFVTDI